MNNNLKYWLALNRIDGLGPVTIKKLWDHFGDIKSAWEADEGKIAEIDGLSKPAVRAFIENRSSIDLDNGLKVLDKYKVNAFTLEDEDYPSQLKNIYDSF